MCHWVLEEGGEVNKGERGRDGDGDGDGGDKWEVVGLSVGSGSFSFRHSRGRSVLRHRVVPHFGGKLSRA